MKRIVSVIVLLLVVYVIYYDLSSGTLPVANEAIANQADEREYNELIPYFEKEVQSGDTLLSIIENQLDSSLPVSIDMVITDFQTLNNGLQPNKIQIGRKYKFPNYQITESEANR